MELRAHPSKKIHAKIYLLYPEDYNEYTFGAAITGSSNLSGNGLGISQEKQYEFNVKLTDYEDVKFAKDEFEELYEGYDFKNVYAPRCINAFPNKRSKLSEVLIRNYK